MVRASLFSAKSNGSQGFLEPHLLFLHEIRYDDSHASATAIQAVDQDCASLLNSLRNKSVSLWKVAFDVGLQAVKYVDFHVNEAILVLYREPVASDKDVRYLVLR